MKAPPEAAVDDMNKKVMMLLILALGLVPLPAGQEDPWSSSPDKVDAVVSLIERSYFRQVEHNKLLYASIHGALDTLDPHSYFLDPESFSRMREEYTGKYYGLGIQIQKQADLIVVIAPIEGTPAYRLGLQPGDIISHINGESTKPLSSYDAMQKLRGPKGTKVTIIIVREGLDKPLELTIEREEIPLSSVPYAYMLDDATGYILIRNFAEATGKEFDEKLDVLTKRGMKRLILDLRLNPGGAFFSSLDMADDFLPKGATIVSIRGRNKRFDREIKAQQNNQYEKLPVVVLIDRGSASASEIVAGAIMDNDRGLIVGEDSWGKGLVQTMFPLSSTMAVALTTAKYYTPSGRSIQRDFTHLDDYYMKKETEVDKREIRYTLKGRKVLGQGGITPDYKIEYLRSLTYEWRNNGCYFSYGRKFGMHQTDLSKKYIFPGEDAAEAVVSGKTVAARPFVVSDAVVEDFKAYLKTLKVDAPADKFQKSLEEIKWYLEQEIVSSLWGIEEGQRVIRLHDPMVQKAISVMPEAAKMIEQ